MLTAGSISRRRASSNADSSELQYPPRNNKTMLPQLSYIARLFALPARAVPKLAILAVGLSSVGCQSAGTTDKVSLRGAFVLAENYEATLSDAEDSFSGDTDYSSFDVALGVVRTRDEDGVRLSRLEVGLGIAEFEELEATELLAGGRLYVGQSDAATSAAPYLSIHSVLTMFDTTSATDGIDTFDIDYGDQIGLRLGGGLEFFVSDTVFLDVGVDYTLPIVAADGQISLSGVSGDIETEVEGFALRLGAGVVL